MLPIDLKKNLKDRCWRLNNLYYITDKAGRQVRFRMNAEQLDYYGGMHTRNIILKARQLGFTTEQCIIQLDAALFESAKCAIIAHKIEDAARFFREKVRYAYDNLPEVIRKANPARNDRAGELVFEKGGSVTVAASFRGGTLRYLHVSEFGKLCAKYPDKAREIVTGAFEAVSKGGVVTIESTAEGREGYFYEYCSASEKLKIAGVLLSELDFKFFFYPWHVNPEYSLDPPVDFSPLAGYFLELEAKHGIRLTEGQKSWYFKKKVTLGDDIFREYPSTPSEAFQVSVEGAYYKKQMLDLYKNKKIGVLPNNDHLPVYTFWDLGVGDSTAIWFVREVGQEFHICDFYENSGEGLRHYFKILKDKGYSYAEHWAPHDIENRQLSNDAKTTKHIAAEGYEIDGAQYKVNFRVIPKLSIEAGINAVREILPSCAFDEKACDHGIKTLESYRKEWNDKLGCWRDSPLHDWSSHGADAFRGFAVKVKNSKRFATKIDMGMAF